ncbi:class I mannose-6-phosphate isomerase [Actinopolymorpha alba]|uniref:class I mannose-6-phosphate isomerase n=1 Tax=Actinopolymorpha alba TaxID=533267 RepID=UPI00036A5455|nr:class I mannose-6-phosphate isomerase [Actinopolymorpha alba]
MAGTVTYDANPAYPPRGDSVVRGWADAIAALPATPFVLAVDGPAILDWTTLVTGLAAVFPAEIPTHTLDLRDSFVPWQKVVDVTASAALPEDPDFTTLATQNLVDLFEHLPDAASPDGGVLIVFGPGAALVRHDILWYADLPKRYAEAAIVAGTARNLGQRAGDGTGTTKRLFYIDWPILDRHRDAIAGRIDRWIDAQDAASPTSLDGTTLRRTIADLATRPFRTRPTFNTTSWGGHWAQQTLGFNRDARNTALGYELIAPESGVLIGPDSGPQVEVPFQLLVSQAPVELLGERVHADFGTSFPIRFDYLDTVGGGNLSVHCHPQPDYMRAIFGWPYTQHETYYILVGGDGRRIFLGLHDGVDIETFQARARDADEHGVAFDIEEYVQTFPATPHQLFMIPAGTPHGSGEGNVVLEISATPYLYSLRFYDWLRRDEAERQRPVHVGHAFANLDTRRQGPAVRERLIQQPRALRTGPGWQEELIGSAPEMFFEVRRIGVAAGKTAEDDTGGRFHVLNVVEGDGVAVETASGRRHDLAYAETMVVPASVGAYRLRALGPHDVRVVKSLVTP